MALKGTLKDFGIADIFQLIGVQIKTGVLKLVDNEKAINVSFVNGKIVGSESTIREKKEHLGEMLLRAGLINKNELTKALNQQKETLQKLGDILLKYDMLTPEELREMIMLQVTETIYGLFRWTKGDYEFVQQNIDYDTENIEPISAESILMEGFRILDEWPKVKRTIKSYDIVFQKTFSAESKIIFGDDSSSPDSMVDDAFEMFESGGSKKSKHKSGQRKLDRNEIRVFRLVDGVKTVQKIINLTRLGEFETCKTLATLLEEGLIEVAVSDKKRKEKKSKYNLLEVFVNIIFLFLFVFIFFLITTYSNIKDLTNISTSHFFEVKEEIILWDFENYRNISKLKNALKVFYLQNNAKYPTDLQTLVDDGLIPKALLKDPWDKNYIYKTDGKSISIERYKKEH